MTEKPSGTSLSTGAGPAVPTGTLALFAGGRFVAELGLLAALGVGGWRLGGRVGGTLAGVVLAMSLPLVAATVWGFWVAPRARRRLDDPARLLIEVALFGGAIATLTVVEAPWWALALGLLWLATALVGRRGY